MAHQIFNNNKAKKDFGSLNEPTNSSDYIKNKKSKLLYNNTIKKNRNCIETSYENLHLIKNGFLNYYNTLQNGIIPFNKTNLQINLITKMNLECVPTLSSNIIYQKQISSTTSPTSPTGTLPFIDYFDTTTNYPFWVLYDVDPTGKLFGYNACSINHYLNYIVLNTLQPNYNSYPDTVLTENCIYS